MVQQSDYPPRWSCNSSDKRVRVELRIPDESQPTGYSWVEIPTVSVEQWIEKGDAAQIQRTAKVRFPTEWGDNTETVEHNSPRQLITQYSDQDSEPFMMARVSWQDYEGNWILQHFGWIGGVGPANPSGTISKFWVYDFAELLAGVPVGETFKNPSVEQVLEIISRKTNENTPIPLSEVTIMPPNSEEEFIELAQEFDSPLASSLKSPVDSDEQDDIRGPSGSAVDGHAYYSLSQDQFVDPQEIRSQGGREALQEAELIGVPRDATDNFEALKVNTGQIPVAGMDTKSFVANHDTLLDMYSWFEEKTAAKLHFEPLPESVVLNADITPERRVFAQKEVIEQKRENGEGDYAFHSPVRVIKNDALYEMKPINTLHLRGSTAQGLLDDTLDFLEGAVSALPFTGPPPAEKYPVVKVQVPELVEAAEGVELSSEVIESDASQLQNAEREAKRLLAQRLEETTEGEVILNGTPRMLPYDRLDAFEVCGDHIQYEQQPVRYEVESVKHEKKSNGVYQTRIKVSVWANDETIETIKSTMVEVTDNRQM